jgi:hypothetical protein
MSSSFKSEPVVAISIPISYQSTQIIQHHVVLQHPIIYHDSGINMVNGFLTGILVEEILD